MRISVDSIERTAGPDGSERVHVKFTLTLGNENRYTDVTTFTGKTFATFDNKSLKRHIVADIAMRYRLANEVLGTMSPKRTDENGKRVFPARFSRDHLRELLYQQERIAQKTKKNISALQLFSMAESTQIMASVIDTASDKEYRIIERTGAAVYPDVFPDVVAKKKEHAKKETPAQSAGAGAAHE